MSNNDTVKFFEDIFTVPLLGTLAFYNKSHKVTNLSGGFYGKRNYCFNLFGCYQFIYLSDLLFYRLFCVK